MEFPVSFIWQFPFLFFLTVFSIILICFSLTICCSNWKELRLKKIETTYWELGLPYRTKHRMEVPEIEDSREVKDHMRYCSSQNHLRRKEDVKIFNRRYVIYHSEKNQKCLGQGCLATLPRGILQGDLGLSDRRGD